MVQKRIQDVVMENILLCLILSQLVLIPPAVKWELDLKVVVASGLIVGLLAGVIINIIASLVTFGLVARLFMGAAVIVLIAGALLLWRFYRDPERIIPDIENGIVCPADGVIKYVKKIEKDRIPYSSKGDERVGLPRALTGILHDGQGYLIGVGMSFLDVHVTRAPIGGRIAYLEHINGSFLSLKRPDALYRNERQNQVVANGTYAVGLIHIASRLVRQIVSYVREGDQLTPGQRIGMIRFGSQVDILLPYVKDLRITVTEGQRVFAGETIIANFPQGSAGGDAEKMEKGNGNV